MKQFHYEIYNNRQKYNYTLFYISNAFTSSARLKLAKNDDTHKEKVPSNKTPALTKSMNIGI